VIALANDIKTGATPILFGSASSGIFVGAPNGIGSEWGFIVRPRNTVVAVAQADYLTKDLGKKKIGLICATQAFGVQSCDAVKAPIEAAGATIVAREDTDVSATNLTTQILDLKNKGADAILGFQFPNVVVVMLNQAAENGLSIPILAGSSTGLAIATKNVTAAGLKNAVGFDDCAPASEARAADFAAKYRAKFNSEPGYIGAEMYDGIMMIAAAVTKAGKADKKAVADALRQTDYKGACTDYKADAGQGLHHSAVFESFDAAGKPKVEKSIAIPAPAGGG
jgi:branched-chain amino acid transport system substrate-binding protein